MDKISELLGEEVQISAIVASRGTAAKAVSGTGGLVGAVVGSALAGNQKGLPTPGGRKGLMFLALGPTKLAFFTAKQGLLKVSPKELIVAHPRADVTALEMEGGFAPKFSISFADGTQYELEVGRAAVKKLKQIKAALGK